MSRVVARRRPTLFVVFFLLFSLFFSYAIWQIEGSIGSKPVASDEQLQKIVSDLVSAVLKTASGSCADLTSSELLNYNDICDQGIKYMQENKVNEGFTCFAKAFESSPDSSRAGILLSLALKQVKRCDSVFPLLEYVNNRNENIGEVFTVFAQCILGGEEPNNNADVIEEAIYILNRGITYEPTALAYYELGNAYRRKGDVDSAVSTFQEAHTKFDLGDDVWYTEMGRALQDGKRYDEALIYMTFAVIEKPDNSHYHYNLASILEKMERYDDAISSLERSIELSPQLIDAHKRIGNIHLKVGRTKDAIKAYKQALEISPGDEALRAVIQQLEKPSFWDEVDDVIAGLDDDEDDDDDDDAEEEGEGEKRKDNEKEIVVKVPSKETPLPKPITTKTKEEEKEEEEEEDEWW
eukprot:TRINITY_DN2097_c0_g5_i1.p1 TRINITY_DN2097_c0_g5~~TRINITY_DN2097_c0_g5_i1.p1  ORF type:complete len:409 (-),score=107.99 TRINITY_DN2097_c0_g5_i1:3-1229(-)